MFRSLRVSVALVALCAASACTETSFSRASFAPGNYLSPPDRSGALQLVESPFRGVPSTGSDLTSPAPIPGSPPTAFR